MVNYINLSFDYDAIYEKDGKPYICNDLISRRWTGRIEFLDDAFFYKQGCCVSVICGSLENNKGLFLGDGKFSIQRTHNLEKHFYEEFWSAKNIQGCKKIRQKYNNALFTFALQAITNITTYRKERWLDPIAYDFIHTPTSRLTIWAAKKLAEKLNIPLVASIHVNEKEIQEIKGNQYPWSQFILSKDKETKMIADVVLAKNHDLYQETKTINTNCIQISNDIDFPTYEDTILSQKDPNTITYVWRVSFAKWFDRFAQIVQKINEKSNKYTFVICWEILEEWEIKKEIKKLKKYRNVYFEGKIGRVAIQDIFLNTWTFILPSRTEIYNQTIMEALFYGCNVICTDVGAAKEQIGKCKSWYILPNDEHFVKKSLEILKKTHIDYQKSAAAYRYANKKFNHNIQRKKKLDILEKMFAHAKPK